MTYLIAAAGTGGHVFPGLAVGEGLMELGVPQSEISFVGGDRLEAVVYPESGFRFIQTELAGLRRSLSASNLRIPGVVRRARRQIITEIEKLEVKTVLGMGGYVTIPAALAARAKRLPLFLAEQNAGAGLANRFSSRWAEERFTSFPDTVGLDSGVWVGNPVRREFWEFDRRSLRPAALEKFELSAEIPTIGVYGGSLGSLAINEAVAQMLESWSGPPIQVIHLTGDAHYDSLATRESPEDVTWRRVGFIEHMEQFFAASELVVARGGGGLAEITATGTPSILVPGEFGSSGHQTDNARFLESVGAARVVPESQLSQLPSEVGRLLFDDVVLAEMRAATADVARPEAALTIARAMMAAT